MPDEITGTSSTPEETPQPTPATNSAPSAAPDLGKPPEAPSVPPPSSQIDDEKLARRFDTERGKWQQYMSDVAHWQGLMQQQLNTVRTLLDDRVARVRELEAQVASLQEQVGAVPGLKEQASQAVQLNAQLDRLKQIAAYPEIVSRTQEQAVSKEDGTTETVRVNPILDMLMNSGLEGDAFHQNLLGVVASLTSSTAPTQPSPPQTPPTAGMTPAPAASNSEEENFWTRYNEIQNGNAPDKYVQLGNLLQERAAQMGQT